jgi:hypothetical protein
LRRMHPWNALFMAALGGLLTYDSSCDKRGHPQSPSYQNLSYCRVFLSLVLVFCWRFTAMLQTISLSWIFSVRYELGWQHWQVQAWKKNGVRREGASSLDLKIMFTVRSVQVVDA